MDHGFTPSQTVGPFFHFSLTTEKSAVRCIAGPNAKGERVWLKCRVLDGDRNPVNDAMVEIWQADSEGRYRHPDDPRHEDGDAECRGFGRLATGEDGGCEFETVRPGRVAGPDGSMQAPHLNAAVFARGMLKQFYTRIYFAGDPENGKDPVLTLVPETRRETLIAQPVAGKPGHWQFDLHLQGEQETVFFDV